MRLPLRLCLVIGLGAVLTGAEDTASLASLSAVATSGAVSPRGASVWGRAVAPLPSGGVLDEDEPEESSCPDWRVRQ